jgi:hypothetical protein
VGAAVLSAVLTGILPVVWRIRDGDLRERVPEPAVSVIV